MTSKFAGFEFSWSQRVGNTARKGAKIAVPLCNVMFIFCYFYCFFCPHVTLIIPDGGGGANPLLGVWALKLTESPHLNFLALLLVQTFVVDSHVTYIIQKVAKRMYCINYLVRSGVPTCDISCVYCSVIGSVLEGTDSRTMLNGCTGKCVRLSRPLVGFWTHFLNHRTFIHSFHSWRRRPSIIIN